MSSSVVIQDLTRTFPARRGWLLSRSTADSASGPETVTALDHVNLSIEEGELFGLLGPNGAGKTTLIKILTTLLHPTSGRAFVKGMDVVSEEGKIRKIINLVTGGEFSGYGLLTVWENLWLFSQFYGVSQKIARERIDGLLDLLEIQPLAKVKLNRLSSGQRQKMNFLRGFVNDPEVLFLDEPTLGLDVSAALVVRNHVKRWVRERPGRTVLLTTHYMMEAEMYCDRVAIIDQGKILTCDTPENLKRALQKESIFEIQLLTPLNGSEALQALDGVKHLYHQKGDDGTCSLKCTLRDDNVLKDLFSLFSSQNLKVLSLRKCEPSLEDVFVSLVGRGLNQEVNGQP